MTVQITGRSTSAAALSESAANRNDLLLEILLELKLNTLHQAEISGTEFDQDDVEVETH
jgi:hypothetical protein